MQTISVDEQILQLQQLTTKVKQERDYWLTPRPEAGTKEIQPRNEKWKIYVGGQEIRQVLH